MQTVAIGPVIGDVTGVFEGQKRHRPGCAVGDAARVIPRNDTVLLTGNDEDRTFDILNDAVERQRRSLFLRFRFGRAVAAGDEGGAG